MNRSILKVSVASLAVMFLVFGAAVANPFGGAISGVSRAPANSANLHRIVYNAGEQADFSIRGDGDTTLNLVVMDDNGTVIRRTIGPGDSAHISWPVSRTQTYTIAVVNEGGVYNQYSWNAF